MFLGRFISGWKCLPGKLSAVRSSSDMKANESGDIGGAEIVSSVVLTGQLTPFKVS